MVEVAGTASGPGAVRPLNTPRPASVEAEDGLPYAVVARGQRLGVASVEDRWRVEDEWWRGQPVARTYVELVLEDGQRLTLFRDDVGEGWFEQSYG